MRILLKMIERRLGKIIPHYDKILHVTVTFILVMFLDRIFPLYDSILIVVFLQTFKTWMNYRVSKDYCFVGDWIANGIGYSLVGIYLMS